MEQIFNPELRNGEKLVWTSKSGKFESWDKLNKISIIVLSAIMAAIVLSIGILVQSVIITVITAIVCIIPIVCLLARIKSDNKKLKSCVYALTNQRAIVYNGDYHSKEYKDIISARSIIDPDGIVSIYFGTDKNITTDSLLKAFTVNSLKPGKSQLGNDFVFFAVDDFEEVTKLLKNYLSIDDTIKCKFALEQ